MTPLANGCPVPPRARPQHHTISRTRRLVLVSASIAILATSASCGGDDDEVSSDPTPATEPTTSGSSPANEPSATSTSGDAETDAGEASDVEADNADTDAGDGALPNACDLIDVESWESITGLDLIVPEQDTELVGSDDGTICGVPAEGTNLPLLFTLQVAPVGSAGGVENLAIFLGVYIGMEQIDGIGDRALYWDQDTTYEGDPVTDWPTLAFEDGAANVTITLNADSLGRAELEQIAQDVAGKL